MFSFRKFWFAIIAAAAFLSPTLATPARAADISSRFPTVQPSKVYDQLRPAVAWVNTVKEVGGEWRQCQATAWVVDKQNRLLVTNNHVAGAAREIAVYFPQWKDGKLITDREWYERHGKSIRARKIVTNPDADLAVIQAEELPEEVKELPVARSGWKAGEVVYTVGNPGHRSDLWAGHTSTVRYVGWDSFQLRGGSRFRGVHQESGLAISGGASGSPVVNAAGEVVAIVFAGTGEKGQPGTRTDSVDVCELHKVLAAAREVLGSKPGKPIPRTPSTPPAAPRGPLGDLLTK